MKKLHIVKEDTMIPMTFSGSFYSRIQALALSMTKSVPEDQLRDELVKIYKGEPTEWGYHLETVLAMIKDMEETITKEKLYQEAPVPEDPS